MKAKKGRGAPLPKTSEPNTLRADREAGDTPENTDRTHAPRQAEARRQPGGKAEVSAALALISLTLLAYCNSFHGGFVLDNRGLLLNDTRIRELTASNLGLIFGHTYWWPNGESGLYRPFTTLSYLFNYAVLGNREQPFGYHAVNFLLHAGNVLLVYALAVRLIRKAWPAFFIAALWVVHPVLTESVANIVGRADLLAAAGVLGGFFLYLKSVEAEGWRRIGYLAGLVLATAVGVFSKESAVILPGAIVLYELAVRGQRTPGRAQWAGLLATLVPVALMLAMRASVLAGTQMEIPFTDNPIAWVDFRTGRLTALTVVAREFALMFWPANLSADYSWWQIPLAHGSAPDWVEFALALAIIPATVFLYRWNRTVFFFFAVGLAWLAPSSNLLFPIGTIMAERLLYLPVLGVVAFVAVAIYAIADRTGASRYAAPLLGVLTLALAARTWVRNADWKDDMSMASSLVRTSPDSFKAHDQLANVLFAADPSHSNIDRVIAESEKSQAILDPLPDNRKPAHVYRFAANCYMIRGAYPKAAGALLRSIAVEKARGGNKEREAEAYLLLSAIYSASGDAARASDATSHAGGLNPLDPQLYRQRADVAVSAGRLDDAAIALVEGTFVTGDKSLRQALVELYRNAMDPKSCVLIAGPAGPAINPGCPAVHAHVCAASAGVIRTLAAAQQYELAQTRKRMFVQQFGCPRGPLDQALP